MSRNLCATSCHECPGTHEHIVLEEEPRPATADDVGAHFAADYVGLIVANARCILCHALYLAWVAWPNSRWGRVPEVPEGRRFFDLSYRHSFNDEPNIEDLPIYDVERVVTYVRKPLNIGWHTYWKYGTPEERAAYERRRAEVLDAKLSIHDELAREKAR